MMAQQALHRLRDGGGGHGADDVGEEVPAHVVQFGDEGFASVLGEVGFGVVLGSSVTCGVLVNGSNCLPWTAYWTARRPVSRSR